MMRCLLALALVGCAGYQATTSGPARPPHPAGCAFEVATAMPEAGYVELGAIEWQGPKSQLPSTLAALHDKAAEQVCAMGGDLVIGQANGDGFFVRGVVLGRDE
jgi:hypothetical protein